MSEHQVSFDELPLGLYEGCSRYQTDDEEVFHVWRDSDSWDVRWPRTDTIEARAKATAALLMRHSVRATPEGLEFKRESGDPAPSTEETP